MIDFIIPTMWKNTDFPLYIEQYLKFEQINKIIIIDNNHLQRPKALNFNNPKIHIVNFNKNIFVNPAWNEGYYRSTSDILCIINDDVFVEEDLINYVSPLDFSNIDIIGTSFPSLKENNILLKKIEVDKTKALGSQHYGFGCCMFIPKLKYSIIPSIYKVWFGDDFLINKLDNIYIINSNKIYGQMSLTVGNNDSNSEISKRINLDTTNAYKFLFGRVM